ncbi:hypothetical protein AB3M80_22505 [Arthrospira platensis BEA 1257B]
MPSDRLEFQGGIEIARIPETSGLYAWYYKPLVIEPKSVEQIISSFLDPPGEISTEIQMRYGVRLVAKLSLDVVYGFKRQLASAVIANAIDSADNLLVNFLKSNSVYFFTRPIYIGIAKNLKQRVYRQHYLCLDELWNEDSPVSKYLNLCPDATVQLTMETLNLPHSFALEARIRKIPLRDLVVHIYPTNALPSDIGPDTEDIESDSASRRALEKLLQLVADPICGRR